MAGEGSDVRLVKVTREELLSFLETAGRRILIAKPGYFKEEAETLVRLAKEQQVECKVYLDPEETALRFGFGEVDALKTLKNHAAHLDLQTVAGIRLSVVIVDDRVLLFTPAALSWEEEPSELTYPNGLEGGKGLVDQLLLQFKISEPAAVLPKNVSIFPSVTVKDIEQAVTEKNLSRTIESLDKNPPVDPSVLRRVNIYRNLYKLVKFQIRGVQVNNKTLDLTPFNRALPASNRHLKRSWQVFTADDAQKVSQFPQFRNKILDVVRENTVLDAGRHGYLIALSKKKAFEEAINESKSSFVEALHREGGPGEVLETVLQQSKTGLVNYLLPEVQAASELPQLLFRNNRIYLKRLKDDDYSEGERAKMLREAITDFVDNTLRFPQAGDLLDSVDITLDYYDVSDELLSNQEFTDLLTQAGVSPRKYQEGYEQDNENRRE